MGETVKTLTFYGHPDFTTSGGAYSIATGADEHSVFIAQGRGYNNEETAYRNAGFTGLILTYQLMCQIQRETSGYGFTGNQLTTSQAVFNLLPASAFLYKDSARTQRIYYSVFYNGIEVKFAWMDPGSTAYRTWVRDRVNALLQAYPNTQGVFWDNYSHGLDQVTGDGATTVYPGSAGSAYTADTFFAAHNGMAAYLRDNVTPRSGEVFLQAANIIHQTSTTDWTQIPIQGIFDESIVGYTNINAFWSASRMDHVISTALAFLAQGSDKFVMAIGQLPGSTSTALNRYALAASLLLQPTANTTTINGYTFPRLTYRGTNYNSYGRNWVFDEYAVALGNPTGPATGSSGNYTRTFERGTVAINATTHTGTITVTGTAPGTGGGGYVFRSYNETEAAAGTTGTTSLGITKPTGTALDDLLVALITCRSATAVFTPPSGWVLRERVQSSGTLASEVYTKVATGSEPASYTWTINANADIGGGIGCYDGIDTTNPVMEVAGQYNSGSSIAFPAITTTAESAVVALAGMAYAFNGAAAPTGYVSRFAQQHPTIQVSSVWFDRLLSTVEPSYSATATPNFTPVSNAAFHLALHLAAPTVAPAIITYRAAATANSDTVTSFAINKPTGTLQDDLMLAGIAIRNTGAVSEVTVTPPSGWTLILRTQQAFDYALLSFYKVAGSSEPASYTWTLGTATDATGGIASYDNVDTSAPIEASAASDNTPASTTATAPSISGTANNLLVILYGMNGITGDFSTPTGMTERFDTGAALVSVSAALSDVILSGSGATGARTSTISYSSESMGQAISLKAAPSVSIPTAPSGLSATPAGQTMILAWTDNAGNEDAYRVYRAISTTASFIQVATLSANSTTYTDTDGIPGTAYDYFVQATNAAGSASSSTVTATWTSLNSTVLTANAQPFPRVDLSWQPIPDAVYYSVERGGSEIVRVPNIETTYQDSSVIGATAYTYRVRALLNTSGAYSAYSNAVTLTTPSYTGQAAGAVPGVERWQRLQVSLWNGPRGAFLDDVTDRLTSLEFGTNKHGYRECRAQLLLPFHESLQLVSQSRVLWLRVHDGAVLLWQGRVEDRAMEATGVRLTALGSQRHFSDIPYTALWSTTDLGRWTVVSRLQDANAAPERFDIRIGDRIQVAPRKNATYAAGDYTDLELLTPYAGRVPFRYLKFTYQLFMPIGWTVAILQVPSGGGTPVAVWSKTTTVDGKTEGGTEIRSLDDAERLLLRFTAPATTLTDETGDVFMAFSAIRVSGSSSGTVTPAMIAADMIDAVRDDNPDWLSSDLSQIRTATIDLEEREATDANMADLLDNLAAAGDPATGLPWEWRVDDDLRLRLQPKGTDGRAWFVDVETLTIEQTIETLTNQNYYTAKASTGIVRSATLTDHASVNRAGLVRRTALNLEGIPAAWMDAYQSAYLTDHAEPPPRAEIAVTEVFDQHGIRWPLNMVKAGDTITIRNLPPTLTRVIDRLRTFRIAETRYNAMSDELTIVPEAPLATLDVLLTQIGKA